jgi:hypothetical protein
MIEFERNSITIEKELVWLAEIIDIQIKLYLVHETNYESIEQLMPNDLNDDDTPYGIFVKEKELNFQERIILALILATHLKPELLDVFFSKNAMYDRGFTEFGGIIGKESCGFLPTVQTILFILAGGDLAKQFQARQLLTISVLFESDGALKIQPPTDKFVPFINSTIKIKELYFLRFIGLK